MTDPLLTAMAAWHDEAHADDAPVTRVDLDALADRIAVLETALREHRHGEPEPQPDPEPVPEPPPPPPSALAYGSVACDSKNNLMIGPMGRISHRFRASTSSLLLRVRWPQRWGLDSQGREAYSGGDGGKIRISLQADVGGHPSGVPLAACPDYVPGNAWNTIQGNSKYYEHSFTTPYTVTKGTVYHVVFENVHSNPAANWISTNEIFSWEPTNPIQPTLDPITACLNDKGGWQITQSNKNTPVMDLTYADGTHDGQAYIQSMRDYRAPVQGANKVRQRFTRSGPDMAVTTLGLKIMRASGSTPLTVQIIGNGETRTLTFPASSVYLGNDDLDATKPSGRWITDTFPALNIRQGVMYDILLSTDTATRYVVVPVREGHQEGFRSFAFRDGQAEKSSGGAWAPLYAYSPTDLSFYLR